MQKRRKKLKSRRIGIIGSRRRAELEDRTLIMGTFLCVYRIGDTIVSGGCPRGGDAFAEQIADFCGIPIKVHNADWKRYGRGAGFKRNTYIARDSDILIACVASDRKGGTEDTIRKYIKEHPKGKLIIC